MALNTADKTANKIILLLDKHNTQDVIRIFEDIGEYANSRVKAELDFFTELNNRIKHSNGVEKNNTKDL